VVGGANAHVVIDIVGYFTKAELRKYYLTKQADWKPGGEASTACATGYHMASLMEIFDTSNLSYNTSLGETSADSGSGPPAWIWGWIRTGSTSMPDTVEGRANCLGWTNSTAFEQGTVVRASSLSWTDPATAVSPWHASNPVCSNNLASWCVED